MDLENSDLEQIVDIYVKIRETIREKEAQHEEELRELKDQLDIVGDHLLTVCNESNVDSMRTKAGTVSRRIQTRYWTSDWDSMSEFIRENDAIFLLEKRIHNGNMKQFLDENPDLLPKGLQIDRAYRIQVRKPTAK